MKHDEVQPLIEEVIARKSTLQRLERYISDTPDIKNINAPFTISDEDEANGHPKSGDWIGINASNPRDRWLITKEFFDDNYEIISSRRNDSTEELIKEKGLTGPRLTKDDLDAKIASSSVIYRMTEGGKQMVLGVYIMKNDFVVIGDPIVFDGPFASPVVAGMNLITERVGKKTLRFAYREISDSQIYIGRPSASVSPENDDQEVGEKIAMDNLSEEEQHGCIHVVQTGYDKDKANRMALDNAYHKIWEIEGYLLQESLADNASSDTSED